MSKLISLTFNNVKDVGWLLQKAIQIEWLKHFNKTQLWLKKIPNDTTKNQISGNYNLTVPLGGRTEYSGIRNFSFDKFMFWKKKKASNNDCNKPKKKKRKTKVKPKKCKKAKKKKCMTALKTPCLDPKVKKSKKATHDKKTDKGSKTKEPCTSPKDIEKPASGKGGDPCCENKAEKKKVEKKKDDPCKKKEVKKDDPCEKKEKKKEDPCKKKEKKKEDPCKKKEKKKQDPCKKKEKKKEDPCKKKEEKKEDPCKKKEKKKEDPCKKKEEKKEDPCKKKEKKEDPCKKKEKKKADPCKKKEKKKEDPCKKKEKKKEETCKKKEDPCKKKEVKEIDPCKKKEKKEDPCKKNEVKKDDPCMKKEKKEDPCKKKEAKKKDPCKKKEKTADPCKKKEVKKEDPCKKNEKKDDPCKKMSTMKEICENIGKKGEHLCKKLTLLNFDRKHLQDKSKEYTNKKCLNHENKNILGSLATVWVLFDQIARNIFEFVSPPKICKNHSILHPQYNNKCVSFEILKFQDKNDHMSSNKVLFGSSQVHGFDPCSESYKERRGKIKECYDPIKPSPMDELWQSGGPYWPFYDECYKTQKRPNTYKAGEDPNSNNMLCVGMNNYRNVIRSIFNTTDYTDKNESFASLEPLESSEKNNLNHLCGFLRGNTFLFNNSPAPNFDPCNETTKQRRGRIKECYDPKVRSAMDKLWESNSTYWPFYNECHKRLKRPNTYRPGEDPNSNNLLFVDLKKLACSKNGHYLNHNETSEKGMLNSLDSLQGPENIKLIGLSKFSIASRCLFGNSSISGIDTCNDSTRQKYIKECYGPRVKSLMDMGRPYWLSYKFHGRITKPDACGPEEDPNSNNLSCTTHSGSAIKKSKIISNYLLMNILLEYGINNRLFEGNKINIESHGTRKYADFSLN